MVHSEESFVLWSTCQEKVELIALGKRMPSPKELTDLLTAILALIRDQREQLYSLESNLESLQNSHT